MKKAKKRIAKKKRTNNKRFISTVTGKPMSLAQMDKLMGYDPELKFSENKMPFTPAPLCLCGQLEDAILLLETRISNSIAKINSLM